MGDNQALAVNTTDGTADNRNEAYALASCRDCATVAVGFQVVLVVGQANVVVPQNIAVAVNYACVECLTVAAARQLVVTLPHALSDAAMAELARVWAQLEEFGRRIGQLPLDQVQAELTRFEARILDIVRRDVELMPGAPGNSTTGPPGAVHDRARKPNHDTTSGYDHHTAAGDVAEPGTDNAAKLDERAGARLTEPGAVDNAVAEGRLPHPP